MMNVFIRARWMFSLWSSYFKYFEIINNPFYKQYLHQEYCQFLHLKHLAMITFSLWNLLKNKIFSIQLNFVGLWIMHRLICLLQFILRPGIHISSASTESTNFEWCGTVVFTMEIYPCISVLLQFKPIL